MLADISTLSTQLLAVAATTNVIVNLLKAYLPVLAKADSNDKKIADLKYAIAILVSVVLCFTSNVDLLSAAQNTPLYYVGVVGAGLIAGLGSSFIHEVISVLQTIKTMKK